MSLTKERTTATCPLLATKQQTLNRLAEGKPSRKYQTLIQLDPESSIEGRQLFRNNFVVSILPLMVMTKSLRDPSGSCSSHAVRSFTDLQVNPTFS